MLELEKIKSGHWDLLEADLTKEEMKDLRATNVDRAHIKAQADNKAKEGD